MTALGRLGSDRRGTAIIEFALVGPIFLWLLIGAIEMELMMLADASLEIGIRAASRLGSISRAGTAAERRSAVEQIVLDTTSRWLPSKGASVKVETNVYPDLTNIGKPTWVDYNSNALCDEGEGVCPADGGVQLIPGMGEKGALVAYRVTMTRPGFTGILRLIGVNELVFRRQIVLLNE